MLSSTMYAINAQLGKKIGQRMVSATCVMGRHDVTVLELLPPYLAHC